MSKLTHCWNVTARVIRGIFATAVGCLYAYVLYTKMLLPFLQWFYPYYAPYAWFLTPALSIIVFSFLSIVGLIAWGIYDGYQDEVRIQKQKEFSFFQ